MVKSIYVIKSNFKNKEQNKETTKQNAIKSHAEHFNGYSYW